MTTQTTSVGTTATTMDSLTNWHYEETLSRCTKYLCKEYSIPCQVDTLIVHMLSNGFLDASDSMYITETVHTRDKLLQLLAKIKEAKHKPINEAFEEMVRHLKEDTRRLDIPAKLQETLQEVSTLQPKEEEQLIERVRKISDNIMHVTPSEVKNSLQEFLAHFDSWRQSMTRSSTSRSVGVQSTSELATQEVDDNNSPLTQAIIDDNYETLQQTFHNSHRNNINKSINTKGQTVLIVACQRASGNFVRRLLTNEIVDVNLKDNCGITALMYSVMRGDVGVISALLDCDRLDIQVYDNIGLTFIWYILGEDVMKDLTLGTQLQNSQLDKSLKSFGVNIKAMKDILNWERIKDIVKLLLSSTCIDNGDLLKTMVLVGCESVVSLILAHDNLKISENDAVDIILNCITSNNAQIIKLVANSSKIPFHSLDTQSVNVILKHPHFTCDLHELILSLSKGEHLCEKLRLALVMMSIDVFALSVLLKRYDIDSLNTREGSDYNVFMLLCRYGSYELLSELLKHRRVDFSHRKNTKQQTPMMLSFKNSSTDIPLLLYNHYKDTKTKLNVNKCDGSGVTYLMYASRCGNYDMVETLLPESKIKVNLQDKNGTTALMMASEKGHILVVSLLLSHDADVKMQNNFGSSALYMACSSGHDIIVSQLIASGSDVNLRDHEGRTMLMCACENGKGTVVSQLIANGADINAMIPGSIPAYTALHAACDNGDVSIMSQLLNGCHVNGRGNCSWLVLYTACRDGNLPVVTQLIAGGMDVTDKTNWVWLALYIASLYGHLLVVSQEIAGGTNVNVTNKHGWTALHGAALNGHWSVVCKLISYGALVKETDESGRTALHAACYTARDSVVLRLLESGADVNTTDKWGNTALTLACRFGHTSVVAILISNGADVNVRDKCGNTVLHVACNKGDISVVLKLLQVPHIDVTVRNNDGQMALQFAKQSCHNHVVRLLTQLMPRSLHEEVAIKRPLKLSFRKSMICYGAVGGATP